MTPPPHYGSREHLDKLVALLVSRHTLSQDDIATLREVVGDIAEREHARGWDERGQEVSRLRQALTVCGERLEADDAGKIEIEPLVTITAYIEWALRTAAPRG